MGYSSNLCKRCDCGILDANATDEGINEWMAEVVILNPNGRMTVDTDYTGHVGDYERFDGPDSVWLHKACWELLGHPTNTDDFDGPSGGDDHQGAGGLHAHIIDPRITDEAERARLLAEGLEKRSARIYTRNAGMVYDWLDPKELKWHQEKHGDELWRLRFNQYYNDFVVDENGEKVLSDPEKPWSFIDDENTWTYYDKLDGERENPGTRFEGTEEELKAHLARLWTRFIESDECAAYLAHREAEIAKLKAERLEELKAEGRFKVDGNAWDHTLLYVKDSFTYRHDLEKFSTGDSFKEAREKAQAKARMLNEAWAAAGYPQDFEHESFTFEDFDY
jgi:hypothetical protein